MLCCREVISQLCDLLAIASNLQIGNGSHVCDAAQRPRRHHSQSSRSDQHSLGGSMGDVAMEPTPRVWVVVGASRGIGLEYVRQVRPDRGRSHCLLSQATL